MLHPQELPENPIFADVAVYNRTVMTAKQLPMVIDKAISTAYEKQGVAAVVIPKDFAWAKIEDDYIPSAGVFAQPEWERPARDEDVKKVADDDAFFGIDVENVNIATAHFLNMGKERRFTTSPLYATMGYGIPSGLAAKLEYPDREVWPLSGDGGFAMMSQDLVAQRDQKLGIINVVFTNKSLGFIEAEQDDTHQPHSGIDLSDIDFAKVAEGFGVKGYTVHNGEDFAEVIKEVKGNKNYLVALDLYQCSARAAARQLISRFGVSHQLTTVPASRLPLS